MQISDPDQSNLSLSSALPLINDPERWVIWSEKDLDRITLGQGNLRKKTFNERHFPHRSRR